LQFDSHRPMGNRFSLRQLLLWMVVIGLFLAGIAKLAELVRMARYDVEITRYGGRRFTREQAEAIAGYSLEHLPENEFQAPTSEPAPQ
jgi:hypothetical protein